MDRLERIEARLEALEGGICDEEEVLEKCDVATEEAGPVVAEGDELGEGWSHRSCNFTLENGTKVVVEESFKGCDGVKDYQDYFKGVDELFKEFDRLFARRWFLRW
jgi:hypothetical protein